MILPPRHTVDRFKLDAIESHAAMLARTGNPGLAAFADRITTEVARERFRVAIERDVWRRLYDKHRVFRNIGGRP